MDKIELILVGGGGHCKACIDVIESDGRFSIVGIVDVKERLGETVLGYKIIGADDILPELVSMYKYFIVTLGIRKDFWRKISLFNRINELGGQCPSIISRLAYVAKSAVVADGTIVMHNAVINANAHVGRNCIINTGALVEHDVKVGDHCHISTGSIINGKSTIGNRVFIGSQSVVIDFLGVTDDVVVGAGTVVVKSIEKAGVYLGSPARLLGKEGREYYEG